MRMITGRTNQVKTEIEEMRETRAVGDMNNVNARYLEMLNITMANICDYLATLVNISNCR